MCSSDLMIDDLDSGRAQAADLMDELTHRMRTCVLGVPPSPVTPGPITEVSQLLVDLYELGGTTECRLDHDSNCQEHGWLDATDDRVCPVARLRMLIADVDADIVGVPDTASPARQVFPARSPLPDLRVRAVRGVETFERLGDTKMWVVKGMSEARFTWKEINCCDLTDVTGDQS